MFPHVVTVAPSVLPVSCSDLGALSALLREVTALMVGLAALCTAILRYGSYQDHRKVLRATTAVAVVARSQTKAGKGTKVPRPRKASRAGTSTPPRHNDGRSRSDRRGRT